MSNTNSSKKITPRVPLDVFTIIGSHLPVSDILSLLRSNSSLQRLLAPGLYDRFVLDLSRDKEAIESSLRLLCIDNEHHPYARICRSFTVQVPAKREVVAPERWQAFEQQIATTLTHLSNLCDYTDWVGEVTLSSPVWHSLRTLVGRESHLVELNVNFGDPSLSAPQIEPQGALEIEDPSAFCSLATPNLRRIRLDFKGHETPDPTWLPKMLEQAPNLEELFLGQEIGSEEHSRRFEKFLTQCKLPKLHTLTIVLEYGYEESLAKFVRAHPGLIHLSILAGYDSRPSAYVSHMRPDMFPNLRRFGVQFNDVDCEQHLAVLSPNRPITHVWNIEGIILEDDLQPPLIAPSDFFTDFTSLLYHTHSGPGIQFFAAQLDDSPSRKAFQRFIEEVPNLRELWLYGRELSHEAIVSEWFPVLPRLQFLEALQLPLPAMASSPDVLALASSCSSLRLVFFDHRYSTASSRNDTFEVWRVVRDDDGSGSSVQLESLGFTKEAKPWQMPFLLESGDERFVS